MKQSMLVLVVFLSLGHTASADNFDTRLMNKLSQMLRVTPPKKLIIERMTERQLLDQYKNDTMAECMRGILERFPYCASVINVSNTFIHGMWVKEEDKTVLHIRIYKGGGTAALVHEFLHWALQNNMPFMNSHEIVTPLVDHILVSEEFQTWLQEEEK